MILLGEDGESGALVQAVKALRVAWPSETERDDFISKVTEDFHLRALRGTLLVNYDPKQGDVVAFLTARRPLYVEAIKFLEKLTARQLRSLPDFEKYPAKEPKAPPHQDAAFRRLIAAVQQKLQLAGVKRISRVEEQAALQLYPRLDWSQPGMNPLREHLLRVLRRPTAETDSLEALSQAHQGADRSFRKRLKRLSAKIYNKGKGVSIKMREHLEGRYAKLCFQRVFLPLEADALGKLLGITAANAAKLRERYREQLPSLLPGLGADYEALQDHRSAASREKPL